MTQALPTKPGGFWRRLPRRFLLWLVLPLCLLFLAASGSLYLLCVYKPDLVAASVQQHLTSATSLPWRINGHIRPVIFPRLGIVADNVSVLAAPNNQSFYANAARPLVQAEALRIYLDPATFWELSPRFSLIELDTPTINLVYDGNDRPLWLPPERDEQTAPPDEAFIPKADSAYSFKSVADAVCSPAHLAMQPVLLHNGTFKSYTSDGELLLSFTDVEGRFTPGAAAENLHLSAAFSLPGADLAVTFAFAARVGCEGVPATGRITGELRMTPPGSRTVSGSFSSPFTWQPNGKDVLLPGFVLHAEGDTLRADLTADLAEAECTGKVTLDTLSLPRWFDWGRSLPPGLQMALHKFTGTFDLFVNKEKAEARNLEAQAGLLKIKGSVGAPDFSAPAVVAHVEVLDKPDLDLVLPFLGVVGRYIPEPVAPDFDHLPLAPYPEDPPAPYDPGPSRVGYDINITVAAPMLHGVTGGPIKVRVFPFMVGEIEKTRVSIDAQDLLQGKASGWLDIDRYSILMHYDAADMELALLPENEGSPTRIAGKVTGSCEIDMPMKDEFILDDWPIRIDATVKGLEINGRFRNAPWRISSASASAKGAGSIHAVLKEGVRFGGNWAVAAQGVSTPWNPKGKDSATGNFNGTLHWPPIMGGPPPEDPKKAERKTVSRVNGDVTLQGSLSSPIGSLLLPLKGKLSTTLDWNVVGDRIGLTNAEFSGHGSYAEGSMTIDFSGKSTVMGADPVFKLNPREALSAWGIKAPAWIRAPGLLTGRMEIKTEDDVLRFDKIKVEADGAPITGEISRRPGTANGKNGGDLGHWTVRLAAEHLDVENIFPPDPPGAKSTPASKTPWDLRFMKGLSLDAQIFLNKARKGKLSFDQSKFTAALQRDRFSIEWETNKFYGGTSTLVLQGTAVPETSQVTLRKGLSRMQNISLGDLLYDSTGTRSYAGKADLVADVTGVFSCNADIPAKLSGNWSMSITDGLYPGFLTSQDSTLRNTFDRASASGPLDKGVLRSNNFKLTGTMVDMNGGGWYDLNTKDMNIELSVTFAKIPTVPVRFYGNAASPRMSVRGVDMVVETVQAAGTTVFGLVMGVLELPGRAVQGISSLFGGKESADKKPQQRSPQTLPVTPQPRR